MSKLDLKYSLHLSASIPTKIFLSEHLIVARLELWLMKKFEAWFWYSRRASASKAVVPNNSMFKCQHIAIKSCWILFINEVAKLVNFRLKNSAGSSGFSMPFTSKYLCDNFQNDVNNEHDCFSLTRSGFRGSFSILLPYLESNVRSVVESAW